MFFWNKICVIWLFLFICCVVSAQPLSNSVAKETDFILKSSVKTPGNFIRFKSASFPKWNTQKISAESARNIIPKDFYTSNFGFFCKQELHIEKITKISLHFRLGSLQQCDYYEGKK